MPPEDDTTKLQVGDVVRYRTDCTPSAFLKTHRDPYLVIQMEPAILLVTLEGEPIYNINSIRVHSTLGYLERDEFLTAVRRRRQS